MKDIFPPNSQRSIRNITPPREEGEPVSNYNARDNFGSGLKGKKIRDFRVKTVEREDESQGDDKGDEDRVKESNVNDHGGDFDIHKRRPVMNDDRGGSRWKWWLLGLALVLVTILIVGFGISSQFATAEVTIEPITFEASFEDVLTAHKTTSQDQLGFDVVTIDYQDPKEVVLETLETREVESRASGSITIYNEFSQAEQVLVESTRFESPEGLIYRIPSGVTVPGMSGEEPGQVQVEVVADEPGEDHNIGPTRFTIPGFRGSPRYEGFYAESSSSIDGGEVGVRPVMSDGDMESVRDEFEIDFEEDLVAKARNSVPDGFLLFEGLYSMDEELETEIEGADVVVRMKASLVAILLNERELTQYLYSYLFDGGDEEVEVIDWSTLVLSLRNDTVTEEMESIDLIASGELRFYQRFDKESLASDLVGIPLKDRESINSVLDRYPATRAEAEMSPFWIKKLPSNPDNINIKVTY